ncbi:hypothetical protein U1Q18_047701 [Sarracenia purpurea var. burkii]
MPCRGCLGIKHEAPDVCSRGNKEPYWKLEPKWLTFLEAWQLARKVEKMLGDSLTRRRYSLLLGGNERLVVDGERKIYPQNLHLQFHGRELHSVCFISEDSQSTSKLGLFSKSCWIATGCEDGTVRLNRYVICRNQTQELDEHFSVCLKLRTGSLCDGICTVLLPLQH